MSGNTWPQSSHLAEPLWTDPGLKSGICVHKLISTLKKKRSAGGNEWSNSLPESSQAMKKPAPREHLNKCFILSRAPVSECYAVFLLCGIIFCNCVYALQQIRAMSCNLTSWHVIKPHLSACLQSHFMEIVMSLISSHVIKPHLPACLLYTSDAADD